MRRNATLKGRCVEKKREKKEKKMKFKMKRKNERQRKRKIKPYHIEHRKVAAGIIETSRLV